MGHREYPKRPLVGVGGVVLDGHRVLLVRRVKEPLKGEWSLPGGLVEVGETLSEAVRREIQEETGLLVKVEGVVKVLDRITRDKNMKVRFHYVLVDFLCQSIGGILHAASDASEARWVYHAELAGYSLRPATLRVIEKAFRIPRRPPPPADGVRVVP